MTTLAARLPTLDRRAELDRLDRLAHWLDARWRIPFVGVRFGLDGLIGLIPGVGDTATLAISGWLIWRAQRLGVPPRVIRRMVANVGLDWLAGLVPVLGDVVDIAWKANRRNVDLLRAALRDERTTPAGSGWQRGPDPR